MVGLDERAEFWNTLLRSLLVVRYSLAVYNKMLPRVSSTVDKMAPIELECLVVFNSHKNNRILLCSIVS